MTGIRLRLGRLLGAITALLVLALSVAATASASSSPPACPAGASPGVNPPAACVHTTYKTDSYTAQLTGHKLTLSQRTVGRGQFAYVLFTLTATFSDPLQVCPPGGYTPYADIPCQMGSAKMGITGRYLARHKTLVEDPGLTEEPTVPYGTPDCTANANVGVCTYKFRIYENITPGFSVWVVQVSDGQITQNVGNDLADSGFEFSIGVNVPHVPKPKKTKG